MIQRVNIDDRKYQGVISADHGRVNSAGGFAKARKIFNSISWPIQG